MSAIIIRELIIFSPGLLLPSANSQLKKKDRRDKNQDGIHLPLISLLLQKMDEDFGQPKSCWVSEGLQGKEFYYSCSTRTGVTGELYLDQRLPTPQDSRPEPSAPMAFC